MSSPDDTVQPTPNAVDPELNEHLNTLFQSATKVGGQSLPTPRKTFFTTNKTKLRYGIDGSSLSPGRRAMFGPGKFEDRYKAQLEDMAFGQGESLNLAGLIGLLQLLDFIEAAGRPIKLESGRMRTHLPVITKVLNEFYAQNYEVLRSMGKMFRETLTTELNVSESNDK